MVLPQQHQPRRSLRRSFAPQEAFKDIVIPGVGGDEEDPRVWVPQTECLDFRPLCFCTSNGYYVNLLRFKGGGVLGTHKHPSPVHAYTIKGDWGYLEHDWKAHAGTYVFEPPGETHTLVVDEDCDEMVALFHVTGALIYVDPATGVAYGADYVVGPPANPDDLREKMRADFILLMRAQTLLPAPTKALLKFYAKAWDEAPPAHWSDVIRGLCDEGLVQATRDAAGEPVEVWF